MVPRSTRDGRNWREARVVQGLAEGPVSSTELAARTNTDERYVGEWLTSQAAGGYIKYNESTRGFGFQNAGRKAGMARPKRKASDGYVPLYPILTAHLRAWREQSAHAKDGDFVFPP